MKEDCSLERIQARGIEDMMARLMQAVRLHVCMVVETNSELMGHCIDSCEDNLAVPEHGHFASTDETCILA